MQLFEGLECDTFSPLMDFLYVVYIFTGDLFLSDHSFIFIFLHNRHQI